MAAGSCQPVNGSASGCVHPGMNPDPMPQPRRRRPVALIAVTAAVTAVLVAAGIVALAYLSGGSDGTASASSTPAAASAAPKADDATVRACKAADAATSGNGDPQAVIGAAAVSDEQALRDIAASVTEREHATDALANVRRQTAVYKISTWCIDHGLS